METWLRVVSVGIFCVSLATAAGNGSSNECTFKGKTYDVGEYTLDSYCWKCQCQLTTEGPTVVCKALNPICLIVRKRDTGLHSDKGSCVYQGKTYAVGSYPVTGNCLTCVCQAGIKGPHANCYNLCELGKRSNTDSRLLRRFLQNRRYKTPPPFTTAPQTTTPSPPPYTTRIPPSPPTTNGPGRPHYLDSGHTHVTHPTRSPPPPDVYHQGMHGPPVG